MDHLLMYIYYTWQACSNPCVVLQSPFLLNILIVYYSAFLHNTKNLDLHALLSVSESLDQFKKMLLLGSELHLGLGVPYSMLH